MDAGAAPRMNSEAGNRDGINERRIDQLLRAIGKGCW